MPSTLTPPPATSAPSTTPRAAPRPAVIDLRDPVPAASPARPTLRPRHAPDEAPGAFFVVWHHVLRGIALGCLVFAALAVLLVMLAPPLSDLGFGGMMVFIAMSAGFGVVPGTILGIALAERVLDA